LNKYSFLIIAVSLFIVAAIIENGLLKKQPETHLIDDFREKIHQNEKELSDYLGEITEILGAEEFDGNFVGYLNEHYQSLEEEGFGFLVYESGELKH